MDGAQTFADIFSELDGAPIAGSWRPDLSRALLEIDASLVPVDRQILSPLCEAVARNAAALSAQARLANPASPMKGPAGIHDAHPASSTLFAFLHSQVDGLQRLGAIGLCALLQSSGPGRDAPKELLTRVRGGLGSPGSALSGALGAIGSIPELIRVIETDGPTRESLPKTFMSLWDSWLHATLVHWILTDTAGVRLALEPAVLVPEVAGDHITIDTDQPEEGVQASGCMTEPVQGEGRYETEPTDRGRAKSEELERKSTGDLFAPTAFRLPHALDQRICRGAVVRAQEALAASPQSAGPYAGLALLLGGGLREIDLPTVVWGGPEQARPFAIDADAPVLYRSVKRPAGAVEPSADIAPLLEEVSDVFAWPLPPSVHALLLQLARGAPTPGRHVLPGIGSSRNARERMHRLIEQLVPEAKVGALAPRLVLASEITAVLGSEMAQLSMADTFGMSPIPGYYSSMPETEVATIIASIQSRRFGEPVFAPSDRPGWLGSRLTLTDLAAGLWPESLRNASRAAERSGDSLAAWVAHRNHLVGALCSVTGHRPEDALGRIHLTDVIPEYGLIVLQDKQVDALRAARVAATGRLWLSDLRRYLDRLIALARDKADQPQGALATAILKGEAPLLSVVNNAGETVDLTAAELRGSMPPELSSVSNFFRHRLNQCLLRKRVDPELRHAQMGWVVTSAHLFSELSPRAPKALGADLGATLDDILVADGWYVRSARKTAWSWDGVPMPPPRDWEAAFRAAADEQQGAIKRVRARLRERWKEFKPAVLARIASAVREFCPQLEVDLATGVLQSAHRHPAAVDLTADHHALICDRVRLGDEEPASALEAIMARILLYRMVRRARDKRVIRGPIPSKPVLKITADTSPFLPGMGAAIRHAFLLRSNLQRRAATSSRDQDRLTAWSVLAHSIYRRGEWARAATGAARTLVRAASRGHAIRVAAKTDDGPMHMVFSGIVATLLAKRKRHAPTSPPPSREAIDAWAIKYLSQGADWGADEEAPRLMEATLAAAGRIECSGLERLLVAAGPSTAAESPLRCVARDDDWPVQTSIDGVVDVEQNGPEPGIQASRSGRPAAIAGRREYDDFVALLNKRSFERLRSEPKKKKGKPAAARGTRNWRRSLRTYLELFQKRVETQPNLSLLVDYALDHLRHGSEEGNQLQHRSLHREITQIGWPLLILAADREIREMSADQTLRLYRELVLSKSQKGRPYALEELRRFHRYLVRRHGRQPLDWGELATLAGPRQLSIEPALVLHSEAEAVLEALEDDLQQELARPDASPQFLRLAQLKLLFFLILEAAGIRPGSAYGLTLADVHLLSDSGDFVHVRRGDYGEAKTDTSIGFVPLVGPLWERNRYRIAEFLASQTAAPGGAGTLPLFASQLGGRARVHEHHLTNRLNQLLKWATGDRKASCYWLRKTRITERLHAVTAQSGVTARDVYGALITSGHAWIEVTLERYLNDPCCVTGAHFRYANAVSRGELLAFSGLCGGAVDVAWHRAANLPLARSRVLLDRLGVDPAAPPSESRQPPPALRRFQGLRPSHLDAFARALHEGASEADAALLAGITQPQADAFQASARALFERRQRAPWPVAGRHTVREILTPPRRLDGLETWLEQLSGRPPAALVELAEVWSMQPFLDRFYGDGVLARLDQEHVNVVAALLDESKVAAKVIRRADDYLLVAEVPDEGAFGHEAAISWVLALTWIYNRSVNVRPPRSVASEALLQGAQQTYSV